MSETRVCGACPRDIAGLHEDWVFRGGDGALIVFGVGGGFSVHDVTEPTKLVDLVSRIIGLETPPTGDTELGDRCRSVWWRWSDQPVSITSDVWIMAVEQTIELLRAASRRS